MTENLEAPKRPASRLLEPSDHGIDADLDAFDRLASDGGANGTLASVGPTVLDGADPDHTRRRWLAARALYVDDASSEILRVPRSEVAVARGERSSPDPHRRAAARLTPRG